MNKAVGLLPLAQFAQHRAVQVRQRDGRRRRVGCGLTCKRLVLSVPLRWPSTRSGHLSIGLGFCIGTAYMREAGQVRQQRRLRWRL